MIHFYKALSVKKNNIMKKLFVVILLTGVLLASETCYSQVSNSINITAGVISRISVTNKSDLTFGSDIIPGTQKIIDKSAETSGRFSLSGQPGKQISVSFLTPAQLSNGTNAMPVTFSSTDAGYQIPGSSVIDFNPASSANATFGAAGTMTIFLGGKVTPSSGQQTGMYTAAMTVNLQYTGN